MIGATLGRYRVVARLGSGGMGDVYRADDLRLRRPVALKVIRPDTIGAPAAGRLLAEARAASALSHPNIAVIYEVDEADVEGARVAFIAMEYVAGRTLADLAASGALTLDAVLDIGRQVADALAVAHAHGLVHRDIKPSNVMMTDGGLVKVLDFGVAYRMTPPVAASEETTHADDRTTGGATGFIGTLAYVAPEQATGREIDGRADMFSLGVVLYELLCGARPFRGDTPVQILEALLRDDPQPIAQAETGAARDAAGDPRLPRVDQIVRRMLAKDPARRYADLRDVSAALTLVARGEDPGFDDRDDEGRALAVMGFANITGNPEDEWLGTGVSETLAADLARLDDVVVIARDRVHELLRTLEAREPERGTGLFLRAGRELGARWLLSGGFQRTGEAVRVTASLTEVVSGRVLRTVKVDGRLGDIFDLQDDVVAQLADGLRAAAARKEASTNGAATETRGTEARAGANAGVAGTGRVDGSHADGDRAVLGGADANAATAANAAEDESSLIEAYEAFSKGVINLRVESYESLDRAVLLFERAVRLDPRYAQAWLDLGTAYATKADYLILPEMRERALTAYRRSLKLRPDSVRAWRELGATLVAMGQQQDGVEAIRRALALDGNDAGANAALGRAMFIGEGRFHEAADQYDRALELNPKGGWFALQLAHCAALAREFARGVAAAERAVTLQERFLSGGDGVIVVGAHMRHGHLAALQDRHAEAVEHFQRELEFLGQVDHALRNRILVELNMRLGASHLRLGQTRRADASLDVALEGFERRLKLGADDPFTRYYAACVHALRGETETALVFLERAAAERPALTRARARIEPEFAAMRADHRFVRFLDDTRGDRRRADN